MVLVGSCSAVTELNQMLKQDQQHGMSVAGVFVPRTDLERAGSMGLQVLGDLDEVARTVQQSDVDAVAVTGGSATRQGYLRQLSWALEGAGVELLVHPGLVEIAGPRMHIRPYVGLPLLHVEQPNFSGWRRVVKRAADLVLTGLGVLLISSELEEIVEGASVVLVLKDGAVVGALNGDAITEDNIMTMIAAAPGADDD